MLITMNPLAYSVLRSLPVEGPVEKFIAIKFASKYGLQATPDFTRSGLLKALGIPPNTGREPLKKLLDKHFIEAIQQHWHPGPPHYSFQFKSEAAFPDGYDDSATSPHQSKIAQLLEWNESPPENRRHQLTIAQRVFLMLLLANATRCGVVDSLSQSDLARQLATTNQRIRYECDNLKRYEYIRRTVDGGNFERLLGRQKSIYFLELHHEAYGDHQSAGSTVIVKKLTTNPISDAIHAYRQFKRYRRQNPGRILNSHVANRPAFHLADLLATNRKTPGSRYTEVRTAEIHQILRLIDRLAEWTLRNYSEHIERLESSELIRTLYSKIGLYIGQPDDEEIDYTTLTEPYASRIIDAYNLVNDEDVAHTFVPHNIDSSTDTRSEAQLFLIACIIQRARTALFALRKTGEEVISSTAYLILPYPNATGSSPAFCVESYPSDQHSMDHELWVYSPDPDGPDDPNDPICTIDDLTLGLLEATSLRTLPRESPCLKRPPNRRKTKDPN